VLLDDLVLDVTEYMDNHPGGKFLIEYNIGRDISKYFYGGYGLDGNLIANGSLKNTHSNMARLQVNSLAIARLIASTSVPDMPAQCIA
jgi:cytochrome b involved in lipid metabolism